MQNTASLTRRQRKIYKKETSKKTAMAGAVCSFPPLSEAAPFLKPELKLELIQTQMAQKPMLRAEV
jgi:hypothetical protein